MEQVSEDTGRAIIQGVWQMTLAAFPEGQSPIPIVTDNVTSVNSVTYIDCDGALQTMPEADWSWTNARNKVYVEVSNWPSTDQSSESDKVFVEYTAGVQSEQSVPRIVKQAILLEVGRTFYDPAQENTLNTNDGKSYQMLIQRLRNTYYP